MTISVLQTADNADGLPSTTLSVTLTVSANSYLHVCTQTYGGTVFTTSMTSTPSLTWNWLGRQRQPFLSYYQDQWVSSATSSGSITITANRSGSATGSIVVKEIGDSSGYDSASLCANSTSLLPANTVYGTDGVSSGKTNKLSAQPALISAFGTDGNNFSILKGTGFTEDGFDSSSSNSNILESKRVTSTAPVEALYTSNSSSSNQVMVFMAVFLENGAQPDPQVLSWTKA